jgi:hypothetical protein
MKEVKLRRWLILVVVIFVLLELYLDISEIYLREKNELVFLFKINDIIQTSKIAVL